MKKFRNFVLVSLMALAIVAGFAFKNNEFTPEASTPPVSKEYKVGWSIYAGWNPWAYAQKSGILKKWGDKYNVNIKLIKMDYIASIEAYTSKELDACVMTNMDALTIPVASGVPTTAVIVGDFSNGNDAILVRDNITIQDLPNYKTALVEYSVSHYLYSRAHDLNKLKVNPKNVLNVSDSDIGPAFVSDKNQKTMVTWNPIVMEVLQTPGITKIFDSSEIPGEILDIMMVNSDVLASNPNLAKALTGAWYEVMSIMASRGDRANGAKTVMAEAGGSDLAEYNAQLKTTAMFYKAASAAAYTKSAEVEKNMILVRNFCSKHKLLGVDDKDKLGILFADGSTLGDANNILFTFDASYMEMAATGELY